MDLIAGKVKKRLGKRTAARDVFILTIGTAFAQGLMIAALPILSRLYTPGDFGVLAVFLAASTVAATLITGRYETSIILPAKDSEAANLVLLSFLLAIFGSALLGFLSIFIPENFQDAVGLGALKGWLPLVFLMAGLTAIMAIVQGWLNRRKRYTQIASLRVLQSSIIAGLAALFGLLPNVDDGLLLAQFLACICAGLVALWLVRPVETLWDKQLLTQVARTHNRAPKYLLPTALLDVIALQIPVVLIAALYSESMAGQFSMAWRLLMMPMGLVGAAVGMVFMQRFAIAQDAASARRLLKKTWLLLLALGLPPLLLILFFGTNIFSFFLGDKFAYSGILASIMAPMALAMFISSPTSGAYIVLNLQRYNLIFGVTTAIYRPACLFIGVTYESIELGVILWVFLDVLVLLLYQLIAWRSAGRIS